MSNVIDVRSIKKEDIKGYECRFVVMCPPKYLNGDDLHVVKEVVHLHDGRTFNNLRKIKNFKRHFWIHRKGKQTYKQKREWVPIDETIRFETTQSKLMDNIAKAVGNPGFRGNFKRLARDPYLYGADIQSTALVKQSYVNKFPDLITPFSMAAFDIETDTVYGTGEIIMASLSFKDKLVTAIRRDFLKGYSDPEKRLRNAMEKYLGEYIKKRNIKWEIVFVDTPAQVVIECVNRAHLWQPDFFAIWNIDFDLPKCLAALTKEGYDHAKVFSDPSIPDEFKHFEYKVGPRQKVTASGKIDPIKHSAQWHITYCPSSFYMIDAMCAYRHIRTGKAEEPSYGLDAIMFKHLGVRKLDFEEAEGLDGLDWHQFMQERYPIEYCIYNTFDCIGMEELDEETNDLALSLPMMSSISDFDKFVSQPRRLSDKLHFFALERGHVIGTTSDQMNDEFTKYVVGLDQWIITLPAHLVVDNGLCIFEEDPFIRSNFRIAVAD